MSAIEKKFLSLMSLLDLFSIHVTAKCKAILDHSRVTMLNEQMSAQSCILSKKFYSEYNHSN